MTIGNRADYFEYYGDVIALLFIRLPRGAH